MTLDRLTGRHRGVLKALANSDTPLSVSRIMEESALLQHEANRVLTELLDAELVERTMTDRGVLYTITPDGYARWEETQPASGRGNRNETLNRWTQ